MFVHSVSRDVASVVLRVLVGFVGVLLFLVYDYHSEVVKRCKYRRTSSNDHLYLAALYSSVRVESLSVGQSRVDYSYLATVS